MASTTAIMVIIILIIFDREIVSSKRSMENNMGIIIDILVAIDVRAMPALCEDTPIRKNITTKSNPIMPAKGSQLACSISWVLKLSGLKMSPSAVADK